MLRSTGGEPDRASYSEAAEDRFWQIIPRIEAQLPGMIIATPPNTISGVASKEYTIQVTFIDEGSMNLLMVPTGQGLTPCMFTPS